MQLIDYGIRDPLPGMGITVVLPALRVSAVEVNNHGANAIHSGRPRVGIARLRALAVSHRLIGIIGTVQIAFRLQEPCSVHISGHGEPLRPVIRRSITALIQIHINLIGKRRPHSENCLLRRPYSAEVIALVGIRLLKLLCGIDIRHSYLILHTVKADSVILINIQPGLRCQDINVIPTGLYLADCDLPVPAENFVCLLGLFNRGCHLHTDCRIFIVIGRFFQLDSNDNIIPVLPGIALHTGLDIDVHRSRNHLRDVNELIHIHILCPVLRAHNKPYARHSGGNLHGCHLLAIRLLEVVIRATAAGFPEPYPPRSIVSVRPVIMQLYYSAPLCPNRHWLTEKAAYRRKHQQHRQSEANTPFSYSLPHFSLYSFIFYIILPICKTYKFPSNSCAGCT